MATYDPVRGIDFESYREQRPPGFNCPHGEPLSANPAVMANCADCYDANDAVMRRLQRAPQSPNRLPPWMRH